jgi:hypothetical protein
MGLLEESSLSFGLSLFLFLNYYALLAGDYFPVGGLFLFKLIF